MAEAKFHEFEVDMTFYMAVNRVRQIMGHETYWLHNQVGGQGWAVYNCGPRIVVRVQDSETATYLRLKL